MYAVPARPCVERWSAMPRRWLRSSTRSTLPDLWAASVPAPLTSALVGDLSRRLFGKRLLVAIPVAAAALLADSPQVAEAGTDGDWTLSGNSLPNSTKFLGSTNAQPLTFKTNNATRMTITSGGNVGVGTTGPGARFHSATSAPIAIYGQNLAGTGVGIGVLGRSGAVSGRGVIGDATSGNGATIGVRGNAASPDGIGVSGFSHWGVGVSGMSNQNYGVHGISSSGVGVVGDSSVNVGVIGTSSSWFGVYGFSDSSIGVYGFSNSNIGVYGDSGLSSGYAGYFSGNVAIEGNLSKGGGSFKIDHPLDPENKYLYHSFVESPDMMNVYNGNVTVEADGTATVELPAWFQTLNTDFRYQLTAIGAPGPNLYIADEITNNRFSIAGGTSGMKVSWQVTGIRKDPYAEAHRIPVEQDKAEKERGKYLYPQEYGQPEDRGLNYDQQQAYQAALK
jgi:hypothetical protein